MNVRGQHHRTIWLQKDDPRVVRMTACRFTSGCLRLRLIGKMRDGLAEIPIEERNSEEVTRADGWSGGRHVELSLAPLTSPAANYGFDVTPRRLITGLITERGICQPNETSILAIFPEHAS